MKGENLGAVGERRAAAYLEACGYTVLESNWRVGHKEIDIICTDGDRIIVVEVKTRRAGVDYPAELMDRKKKHNLLKAGAAYLQRYGLEKELRFDLVIVEGGNGPVRHIREAIQIFD
ncbi:MAG: YraN family protein [Odoribacter sp.]|nr:YraN family protein [Odoribacter sp.]MDE6877648.1 YraN family protein [Odoribacter sp.]